MHIQHEQTDQRKPIKPHERLDSKSNDIKSLLLNHESEW